MPKDQRKKRAQFTFDHLKEFWNFNFFNGRGCVNFIYDMILYYIDTHTGNVWVWDGCQTIYIKLFVFFVTKSIRAVIKFW